MKKIIILFTLLIFITSCWNNKTEIQANDTNENITDYQAAALIMAIYINGMTDQEITDLTLAMAYSGEVLDLTAIGNNIVDKHSTGGVGDKITLILMPVIASLRCSGC